MWGGGGDEINKQLFSTRYTIYVSSHFLQWLLRKHNFFQRFLFRCGLYAFVQTVSIYASLSLSRAGNPLLCVCVALSSSIVDYLIL